MNENQKIKLDRFQNQGFDRGRNLWVIIIWIFVDVCFVRNPLNLSVQLKSLILRLFGATIGKGVILKPGIHIKYPWKLVIGDNVWIGEKVWIDNITDVKIQDNVCISQGAFLLTGNHDYKKITFDLLPGPINLLEGVWIGARAVVCPGVTAGQYSVLTVSSVAVTDLEEEMIYQGNPAQPKRKRWG